MYESSQWESIVLNTFSAVDLNVQFTAPRGHIYGGLVLQVGVGRGVDNPTPYKSLKTKKDKLLRKDMDGKCVILSITQC
jgi:hypothetical protein